MKIKPVYCTAITHVRTGIRDRLQSFWATVTAVYRSTIYNIIGYWYQVQWFVFYRTIIAWIGGCLCYVSMPMRHIWVRLLLDTEAALPISCLVTKINAPNLGWITPIFHCVSLSHYLIAKIVCGLRTVKAGAVHISAGGSILIQRRKNVAHRRLLTHDRNKLRRQPVAQHPTILLNAFTCLWGPSKLDDELAKLSYDNFAAKFIFCF